MRTIIRASIGRMIQIVIQIVLLPFAAVGYVLFVVKLVRFSRRTSTSATILASFYTRYMQHCVTGEPWKFGIDNTQPVRARVAAFLESCGLALEEQRNFGPEPNRKRAMAGFATGMVSPTVG